MRTIEKTIYTFSELSEKSKERARRDSVENIADFWDECALDDFQTVVSILGFYDFKVYYSGFSSQGDGACFTGEYRYEKNAAKKIKDYAPKDIELIRIAQNFQEIQRCQFYKLRASIRHRGNYYHEKSMVFDIEHLSDRYKNVDNCGLDECFRDLAQWIYSRLRDEWEYQISDECTDMNMIENEYEFYENGERA